MTYRGQSFPQVHSPPVTIHLTREDIHVPDPRNGLTCGKAAARRDSEIAGDLQKLIDDTIQKLGDDPRAWSDETLDAIAGLEARRAALESLATRARRLHPDWMTKPLKEAP